jgi:hypothetical protein
MNATGEFTILDNGLRFADGRLRYAWFRLTDPAGPEFVRAIAFRELAYLPIEVRDDPDVLGKQWAAIRGLYNAGVDFLYAAMGVFRPEHVGVMQFYGAAAEASTEDEAATIALRGAAAVEATLANYPQSRLLAVDGRRVQMLLDRMARLSCLLAILGHPDPRLAQKGLGRDGAMGMADDELLSQQGENLLRGLAKLREDFVFQVTTAHIGRRRLAADLVNMARTASQFASRQRGAIGAGFSLAIPLGAALSNAVAGNHSGSTSHSTSQADAVSQGWSVAEGQSWGHSVAQGQSHGTAHTESTSVTDSTGVTQSQSGAAGWGHTDSQAHTDSLAHTDSQAHTDSHSTGVAHSEGSSWSTSVSEGVSQGTTVSSGEAHGASSGWSAGSSDSVSHGSSAGSTVSTGSSAGGSESTSTGESHSAGSSDSASQGSSWGSGHASGQSNTVGASAQAGIPGVGSVGASYQHGWNDSDSTNQGGSAETGHSASQSDSTNTGASQGSSWSASSGVSNSVSQSQGQGHGTSQGVSGGTSDSQSSGVAQSTATSTTTSHSSGGFNSNTQSESWGTADTRGTADTKGSADSRGAADSTSGSRGWGVAESSMHAVSRGSADSESWSESVSEGWSEGRSVSRGVQGGRSHGWGEAEGVATGVGAGQSFSGGFSAGLVPGASISRNWQTEDDVAIRLTEITRGLESLLNTASHEGGFMTTALVFVDETGERAARALVPQSFHGPNVPTPVLTVPGDALLRQHALAFRPSLIEEGDPFRADLWTRWGTLLTPAMLAALTSPNLFEEGTAVTIQEKLPPLGFYPEMPGEVVLAHQCSPETGELTPAPLSLSRARHFHSAFTGDTGYGKTVAAERMVYETTRHWRLKTIVLDFGTGWRKLLNAPGLAGHVEIRQLSPGGVRPLRWNPLQIGRNVPPEVQWRAFSDIFGTIARLGGKRQIHELRERLRQVYLAKGVLVDDPDCRKHSLWGQVNVGEEAAAEQPAGTRLEALTPDARQALAVLRSQFVDLADLHGCITDELARLPARNDFLRNLLEGINQRIAPLVQGAAALQYAKGPDAIDINGIVPGEWGVAILEGGSFLDDFSKAFLLGWATWQLYTDAVLLRTRRGVTAPAHMQIVMEEANKILAGLDNDGGQDDAGSGTSTAEQFANMWRDSRKYGIWLHLITQSPSLIPPGIMSSCNNLFACQVKNSKDRDLVTAAIARSEKGLVDEPWRRFLATLPIGRCIVRLGYTAQRAEMEPVYVQPVMLAAQEPTDADLECMLGRISL